MGCHHPTMLLSCDVAVLGCTILGCHLHGMPSSWNVSERGKADYDCWVENEEAKDAGKKVLRKLGHSDSMRRERWLGGNMKKQDAIKRKGKKPHNNP